MIANAPVINGTVKVPLNDGFLVGVFSDVSVNVALVQGGNSAPIATATKSLILGVPVATSIFDYLEVAGTSAGTVSVVYNVKG